MLLESIIHGRKYKLLGVLAGFVVVIALYINLVMRLGEKVKEGYDKVGAFDIKFVMHVSNFIIGILVMTGCQLLIKYIQYCMELHILYKAAITYCILSFKGSDLYETPDILNREYMAKFANLHADTFKSFCNENKNNVLSEEKLIDLMRLSIKRFKKDVLHGYLENRYWEYIKEKKE